MAPDSLYKLRHSLSHILAMAVLEVFPDAKLAIGPPVDNGFYYDFDLPRSIQPEDLPDLQKRMEKIIDQKLDFKQSTHSIQEALQDFAHQPYKLELIKDLAAQGEKTVTYYTSGTLIDLCKGPHLQNTDEVPKGSFTLSHAAGAYWRGSEKNPMLQRIYGLAFSSAAELIEYKEMMEDAKKRDHRVLGPQLGIYAMSEEVGSGLPLWLPKGETIKDVLRRYMREKEQALGYQYVSTPVIAHESLYQRSGHAQFYAEDMYSFKDEEGNTFYIKPMNCPHHHMIYEKMVTSYRDLPLRLAEGDGLYRHELSGTLTGLIRVRGAISQNDAHLYVTPTQLSQEFADVLTLFQEVYKELGVKGYWFRLSLPDFDTNPSKFSGERQRWEDAGKVIKEVLEKDGAPFVEARGEAAFYGPKLDVQIKNVTGKEDTIATIQVDILVPGRMGLHYVDENGTEQTPIVIHRAVLGSYERFIGFLIEQTAGNFPFWLAPVQVAVLALSEHYNESAQHVAKILRENAIRVQVDISNESVGKKIRSASLQKIPVKIVIGKQEAEDFEKTGQWHFKLNWRSDFEGQNQDSVSLKDNLVNFANLIAEKK